MSDKRSSSQLHTDIHNSAYGKGTLLQTVTGVQFKTTKTFDNFTLYEQVREQCQQRLGLQCRSICQLLKFNTSESKALCGQFYQIQLHYQYAQQSLMDLIKLREFSEVELLNIINDVMEALCAFSKYKIRHGMLSPETILCGSDSFMLTDVRFLIELYEYKMQLFGFMNQCYLAPTLFEELGKRTLNPIYNYEKCEIFSLGVVVLECALRKPVQNIYNMDKFTVSQDIINTHLRVVQDLYSQRIADLLGTMLNVEEHRRISSDQLITEIKQYSTHSFGRTPVIPTKQQVISRIIEEVQQQPTHYRKQSPQQQQQMQTQTYSKYKQQSVSPIQPRVQPPQSQQLIQQQPQPQPQQQYNSSYSNCQYNLPTQYIVHHTQNRSDLTQQPTTQQPTTQQPSGYTQPQYQTQEMYSHSQSYISPTRQRNDNQAIELDEKFNQFSSDLQNLRTRFKTMKINTPSSNYQQSIASHSHISVAPYQHSNTSLDDSIQQINERIFPTFHPQFPHTLDIKMDEDDHNESFRMLDQKLQQLKFVKPIPQQLYSDDSTEARLPQSQAIYMHHNGPSYLSDFFIQKR